MRDLFSIFLIRNLFSPSHCIGAYEFCRHHNLQMPRLSIDRNELFHALAMNDLSVNNGIKFRLY